MKQKILLHVKQKLQMNYCLERNSQQQKSECVLYVCSLNQATTTDCKNNLIKNVTFTCFWLDWLPLQMYSTQKALAKQCTAFQSFVIVKFKIFTTQFYNSITGCYTSKTFLLGAIRMYVFDYRLRLMAIWMWLKLLYVRFKLVGNSRLNSFVSLMPVTKITYNQHLIVNIENCQPVCDAFGRTIEAPLGTC